MTPKITAKIIAHSISPSGQHIVTWELEYQRFIHGEFMTHRLFSRNAASSRAIPVKTIIAAVREAYASPIHWGQNEPGMQASQQLEGRNLYDVQGMWEDAAMEAAYIAEKMDKCGAHKQVANRILEPFQMMKTVMTATCLDNFFWLRNHKDAQPEIRELARLMWEALQEALPKAIQLQPGDWHTPYFGDGYWRANSVDDNLKPTNWAGDTLENALAISSSCCAQVSFRKLDDTLEKAQMIYKRLVESEPVHASPFEHSATPMAEYEDEWGVSIVNSPAHPKSWEAGITHADRNGKLWSGNLVGWVQYRQLIPGNVCHEYVGH